MSAPPFFQLAGRRDLKFWGEDDGPTVVVWESLEESEQERWSKRWASPRIEWFGAGRGKKTNSNARLKLMEKKSDADILAAAIEILRKRIAAGTATFLVKVKAH